MVVVPAAVAQVRDLNLEPLLQLLLLAGSRRKHAALGVLGVGLRVHPLVLSFVQLASLFAEFALFVFAPLPSEPAELF